MKLIAHWILGGRLYCVNSTCNQATAKHGDKVAQCPVCFDKDRPYQPSAVSVVRTETIDDYINRLFGES